MSETKAPDTADPPPDGPTPLPPGAPLRYTARLDNALWRAQATPLLRDLLDASHIPATWPREQGWSQTVLLPRDAAAQIAALLADPPGLAVVPVGEFDRVLAMLEAKDTECQAVKTERDAWQQMAERAAGWATEAAADRDAWHAQAVTSADLLESSTDAHEALSAEVARLRDENTRLRTQIAALATERDGWQTRALSAERHMREYVPGMGDR